MLLLLLLLMICLLTYTAEKQPLDKCDEEEEEEDYNMRQLLKEEKLKDKIKPGYVCICYACVYTLLHI